jgi:hypothetical protein
MPPGDNLAAHRGVRQAEGVVQMGLKKAEIDQLARRLKQLLNLVDDGRVAVVQEEPT